MYKVWLCKNKNFLQSKIKASEAMSKDKHWAVNVTKEGKQGREGRRGQDFVSVTDQS